MKNLFKKFVSAAICAVSTFSYGFMPHVFANKCDFDLLEKVSTKDTNALVSPLSLKFAMMMAANGAEGKTREEILNAFEIDNLDDFNEKISQELNTNNDLKIANSIWQKNNTKKISFWQKFWQKNNAEDISFSKEYKNKIKKYFNADAKLFRTVNSINSWVKNKTNGKIKDLLPKELDDDKDFVATLVNAIYFKADWKDPFSANDTRKDTFYNVDNTQKTVKFMNKNSFFNYFGNENFQLLEMEYKNSDLSMYIILPKNDYKVTNEDFENALKNKECTRVDIHLPKFEFKSDSIRLVDYLKNMGVNEAFKKSCKDFNTMFTTKERMNFYISDVMQKTFVKVDEKGTEAAAATYVSFKGVGCCPGRVYFNANHPFTYIIRDNKSGEIAFMGQQCKF